MLPSIIAGFLSGVIGSMGLGGGAVLLIYLASFLGVEQLKAQGINLLFFIPIALLSVIIYTVKKQIKWKAVGLFAVSGLFGALLGTLLASFFGADWTRIVFGLFLITLGAKSLFLSKKEG